MTRTLGRLAEDLLASIQVFSEGHDNSRGCPVVSVTTWVSLVAGGLSSLCFEAISADDFFDEFGVSLQLSGLPDCQTDIVLRVGFWI